MNKLVTVLWLLLVTISCNSEKTQEKSNISTKENIPAPSLTLTEANRLSTMPLACVDTEFPNKLGQTLHSADDLKTPKTLHPAFYGCFDWHSSVHGHWSIVTLLKKYPELENADALIAHLQRNLTQENIEKEVEYFQADKHYERMYGWAWYLKLVTEIHTWDSPITTTLEQNLQPLTNEIVKKYIEYLPKLNYPIRVGTHTNTAFGLTFAWDYANTVQIMS